jgi:hypothetical protein
VIGAGTTVEAHDRWSLPHGRAGSHETHSLDVEVQLYVSNLNSHGATLRPLEHIRGALAFF